MKTKTESRKRSSLEKIFALKLQNARSRKTTKVLFNEDCSIEELIAECVKMYELQGGICIFSGDPLFIPDSKHGKILSKGSNISIDRKDSSLPYQVGNIQIVDVDMNYAKQQLSDEKFIELCNKVTTHNARRNRNNLSTGIHEVLSDLLSVHMVGLHY